MYSIMRSLGYMFIRSRDISASLTDKSVSTEDTQASACDDCVYQLNHVIVRMRRCRSCDCMSINNR